MWAEIHAKTPFSKGVRGFGQWQDVYDDFRLEEVEDYLSKDNSKDHDEMEEKEEVKKEPFRDLSATFEEVWGFPSPSFNKYNIIL